MVGTEHASVRLRAVRWAVECPNLTLAERAVLVDLCVRVSQAADGHELLVQPMIPRIAERTGIAVDTVRQRLVGLNRLGLLKRSGGGALVAVQVGAQPARRRSQATDWDLEVQRVYEDSGFCACWEAYPRKDKKRDAARAWVTEVERKPGPGADELEADIRARVVGVWRGRTRRTVPLFATYLRGAEWEGANEEPGAIIGETAGGAAGSNLDRLRRRAGS